MRSLGAAGLLVSTVRRACGTRLSHDVGDAVVHARVIQQPLIVDLEKPLERVRTLAATGGTHRASDEQAGPLTHHAADLFLGQGLAAELFDQLIG